MSQIVDEETRALVGEPQHKRLQLDLEHGQQWVTCLTCGRQWSIHSDDVEVVTEGDGFCDEEEPPAFAEFWCVPFSPIYEGEES